MFSNVLTKSYNQLIHAIALCESFILSMPIFTTYLRLHPLKKSKSLGKLQNITPVEKE